MREVRALGGFVVIAVVLVVLAVGDGHRELIAHSDRLDRDEEIVLVVVRRDRAVRVIAAR